eukprot:6532618-Pyramimonas_sp.AAC.1
MLNVNPIASMQACERNRFNASLRKKAPAKHRAVTEYVVTDTVIVVNPFTGGADSNVPRCRSSFWSILNP